VHVLGGNNGAGSPSGNVAQAVPAVKQKEKCGWFAPVCNGWQRSMEWVHENQDTLGQIAIDLAQIELGLFAMEGGAALAASGGIAIAGSWGTLTIAAAPAVVLGVSIAAGGAAAAGNGAKNLGQHVDDLHWNNQATGSGGAGKITPKEYSNFSDDGSGILASVDELGVLDTAIKVPDALKGQGVGKKLFRDAMSNIGPENVKVIRGNWHAGDQMADNFNSFKKLATNQSPEDAAKSTFTGKMARDYGFNNLRIVTNNENSVVVEFIR
jgi:hypothetical protein